VVVGRERRRLDHKKIGAPHVFLNFNEDLHIGKTPHDRLCQRELEICGDALGEHRIGIAGDELYRSVLARHPLILALTPATGGVVITRRTGPGNMAGMVVPKLSSKG
jgi:hypothetical protein